MKKLSLSRTVYYLLIVFLFLLPWQTRWIYQMGSLNGAPWEYGTFSWYGTEILLWLIIILFAIDKFAKRKIWGYLLSREHFEARKKYLWGSALVIGFFILQIFRSRIPEVSYYFVFHILAGACLCIILGTLTTWRNNFFVAFWLGGVGQGVLALYQFFTQHISANKWLGLAYHSPYQLGDFVVETGHERWLRAYGSFGSPNILGGFLAVVLLIGLILYFKNTNAWQRLGITLGQLAVVSGLVVSFSRAAWLAAMSGLVVLAIILRQKEAIFEIKKKLIFQLLIYSTLTMCLFVILKPLFLTRGSLNARLEQQSASSRVSQYREWEHLVVATPAILVRGIGPGLYTYELWHLDKWRPGWQYQPIHNSYLLALAELGAFGIIFFVILFYFFWKHIKKYHRLMLPVVAVVLVAALFDHFWWSLYAGQMIVWVVVGLSIIPTQKQIT